MLYKHKILTRELKRSGIETNIATTLLLRNEARCNGVARHVESICSHLRNRARVSTGLSL